MTDIQDDNEDPDEQNVVGHTVIAENREPDNFGCYAVLTGEHKDKEALMEPGQVYEIHIDDDDRCFGIVEGTTRQSESDVISEELSRRGNPDRTPMTSTVIRLRTFRESGVSAPVGRNDIAPAMPDGIQMAYGIPDHGIPIGVYTLASGIPEHTTTVQIPPEYLLGPETAHMNIGGKPGYGKTSMALLASKATLNHDPTGDDTAVIAFNVKSDDLLYADHPNTEHTDDDRQLYDTLDINRAPFADVNIIAPEHPRIEDAPYSERIDAEPFTLLWNNIGRQYRLLMSEDDINDNFLRLGNELASSGQFITFQDVVDQLERTVMNAGGNRNATVLDGPDANRHNVATIRKAVRVFEGIVDGNPGFIDGASDPIDFDSMMEPGRLTVIDIARSEPRQKRAVVSLVRQELQDRLNRRVDDVENILMLTDELNRFAPRSAANEFIKEVKRDIVDMSERGRSIGTALLGVEQKPSAIDRAVTGNVATKAYSRLDMTEMSDQLYSVLSDEKKETVTRLGDGFMMIDFDLFQEPVLTRYPRAPCAQEQPPVFGAANEVWRSVPEGRRDRAVEAIRDGFSSGWDNLNDTLDQLEDLQADPQAVDDLRETVRGED